MDDGSFPQFWGPVGIEPALHGHTQAPHPAEDGEEGSPWGGLIAAGGAGVAASITFTSGPGIAIRVVVGLILVLWA